MSIEFIDYFCQAVITCTGVTSLYLMGGQTARIRMWGGIVGLIGEPFWLTTASINQQYGIMVLCVVYGIAWIRVVWKNWEAENFDSLRL